MYESFVLFFKLKKNLSFKEIIWFIQCPISLGGLCVQIYQIQKLTVSNAQQEILIYSGS